MKLCQDSEVTKVVDGSVCSIVKIPGFTPTVLDSTIDSRTMKNPLVVPHLK